MCHFEQSGQSDTIKKEDKSQIRFLDMSAETITKLLDDPDFFKAYFQFHHLIVEIVKNVLYKSI